MSIVAYSGLPGSGKSYGVVENVIIPALENGRHIITNIPLKLGRIADDFPKGRITTFVNSDAEKDLEFFAPDRHPSGVIWVIDEAWRFWKAGMKSTNLPQSQKEFFTEHRHEVGEDGKTNEIILVTQDLAQLCSFVRSLVEETFRAVKLTAIGSNTKYRIDVYMGAAVGQKPGKPMRQLYGKYKPEIYQYYTSHTKNKTDFAAGMEEKVDDRANVLKHPLVKLGVPFAIAVAVWGVYSVSSYFDQSEAKTETPEATESRTIQPVVQQSPQVQKRNTEEYSRYELNRGPSLSDRWRILGTFNDLVILWSETGERTIHSRNCGKSKKTGEMFCVVDGQLVTKYSARPPGDPRGSGDRFSLESVSDTSSAP